MWHTPTSVVICSLNADNCQVGKNLCQRTYLCFYTLMKRWLVISLFFFDLENTKRKNLTTLLKILKYLFKFSFFLLYLYVFILSSLPLKKSISDWKQFCILSLFFKNKKYERKKRRRKKNKKTLFLLLCPWMENDHQWVWHTLRNKRQ